MDQRKELYLRFIEHGLSSWDQHLKNVALVILDKFPILATTSTAQGRNSIIGTEIKDSLDRGSFQFSENLSEMLATLNSKTKMDEVERLGLAELEIASFRGSHHKKKLNFHPKVTLFFGENGTGKTSIVEALELALTGNIFSLASRGFGDVATYCKNEATGKFETPILTDRGGNRVIPRSSEQFSVIEKRRIERFAELRPDATKSSEDNMLISALFGLESVHDFVTTFGNDISSQLTLPDAGRHKEVYSILDNENREIERLKAGVILEEGESLGSCIERLRKTLEELETRRDTIVGEIHHSEQLLKDLIERPTRSSCILKNAWGFALAVAILLVAYLFGNILLGTVVFLVLILVSVYLSESSYRKAHAKFIVQEETSLLLTSRKEELQNLKISVDKARNDYTNACSLKDKSEKFDYERYKIAKENYENNEHRVAEFKLFTKAYVDLNRELKAFFSEWMKEFTRGLEGSIIKIYNKLQPRDKFRLASISFPAQLSGDSIKICFVGGMNCQATKVMSEGNLKLLGLAILLARSLNLNSPFVIIDDIVGTIDYNRRGRIVSLLSECVGLGKQIILTTHSEDFQSQIQEEFSDDHSLVRLLYSEEFDLSVSVAGASGLISEAEEHCSRGEFKKAGRCIRDCLDKLLHKLWQRYQVDLQLELRGAQINLFALYDGIKKSVSNGSFFGSEADKKTKMETEVFSAFSPNFSWKQMNRSNHFENDTEDLDPEIAEKQINALKTLKKLVR